MPCGNFPSSLSTPTHEPVVDFQKPSWADGISKGRFVRVEHFRQVLSLAQWAFFSSYLIFSAGNFLCAFAVGKVA